MTQSKIRKLANKSLWELHRHGRRASITQVHKSGDDVVYRIDEPTTIEPVWGYPSSVRKILIEEPLRTSWSPHFQPWRFATPPLGSFDTHKYRDRIHFPTAVLIRDLYEWNYFHFHMDTLARMSSVESAGLDQLPLIVGPYARELSFAREALRSGEWSRYDWIVQERNQLIDVAHLYYVSIGSTLGDRAAYLRGKMHGSVEPVQHHNRRLFVTRSGAAGRRIINSQDVCQLLSARGFVEIDAATLPFSEQVKMFAGAERVVALHGAGMVNLVYADPRRLRVLELYGKTYNTFDFREMLRSQGASWSGLEGEPGSGNPQAANYTIDLAALDAAVGALLA